MRLTLCLLCLCVLSACSPSAERDEEPRSYPGETPAPLMTEAEARSAEQALEEAMQMAAEPASQSASTEGDQ